MPEYDAVIIGAGPGGYAAAIRLGQKGKKVALVEKDRIGGECLNYGCIPSKALIEMANSIHYLRSLPGVSLDLRIDMERWQEWKWNMIRRLTGGVEVLCRSYGVEIVQGEARIVDRNTVTVGGRTLSCSNLIIATGSSPVKLRGMEWAMHNREVLDMKRIPESIIIVGGGYIGIEIGTALSKLGSSVTIVEMMPSVLPGVDREIVKLVERRLSELRVNVYTGRKVASAVKEGRVKATLDDGTVLEAEELLVTVGRTPNTQGFGLENLGLRMDGKFIWTDSRKRTSVDGVWAIGDVTTGPMLAHKAYYEADVVADNICGVDTVVDYRAMPFVIFSDPEVAYTGALEGRATSIPLAANGRSLGLNETTGAYRLYFDEQGNINGGAIVAPHASEMISEISLAVESGLNAMDIGLTIHPHPTVSEGIKESAEEQYGKPLHFKPRG
ncbi:dihydrolipoyl dehydrogenase [Thermogymnomonas acidicola]|uniref:Dihydrolipoyl dehydrogenase n=1 Tax=Thermogymnomonas acidicola TaxID=399579 RepID=A0AA37BQE2_9ARCH|nr:dihydrolipoyl dehydrogenase [Thermogymnomonas acidicola]GGM68681.1 dihydrolipoyl dehydrogenase [Thermogymnomonas acidicola]